MDTRVRKPVSHPMPEMAAFVAELKAVFGDAVVDDAITRSKAGEPTFYACENGRAVGTASSKSDSAWRVVNSILDRHFCPGCDGTCVGQDVRCRECLRAVAKRIDRCTCRINQPEYVARQGAARSTGLRGLMRRSMPSKRANSP